MANPDMYIDAVYFDEFSQLAANNQLPLLIATNDEEIRRAPNALRKKIDRYYERNESGYRYLSVVLNSEVKNNLHWGNIVFPNGEKENFKYFFSREISIPERDGETNAIHIKTDKNEYPVIMEMLNLSPKIHSLMDSLGSRSK